MSKYKGLASIHTSHKHIRFKWFKHSRLWVSGVAPKRTQTEEKCVLLWFPDDEQTEQATTPANGWRAALTQVYTVGFYGFSPSRLDMAHRESSLSLYVLSELGCDVCVQLLKLSCRQTSCWKREGWYCLPETPTSRPYYTPHRNDTDFSYSRTAPWWVFEWQPISRKGRRKEGVDSNLPTDQYDPCLSLAGFMEGLLLKAIHWPLSAYFPPETEHCNHSVSFRSGSLAKTLSFLLSQYDLLLTSPCQQFEFSALVLLPPQKGSFHHFCTLLILPVWHFTH